MPLETMSAALARLEGDGFTDDFRAVADGLRHLHDDGESHVMAPEELTVREVVRFEGASDPDEEAAVFALECECGIKGTYVVTYGPGMSPEDNEVVLRLPDGREPPRLA
jgi:hypothetical protein